jgi:hypothetical protein
MIEPGEPLITNKYGQAARAPHRAAIPGTPRRFTPLPAARGLVYFTM